MGDRLDGPLTPPHSLLAPFDAIGRTAVKLKADSVDFFQMAGVLSAAILRVLLRPRSFRLTSSVHHLYRVGWQAIPIIALITFLTGGIIAQQGFFHFRKFGADPYVVDMVGILVVVGSSPRRA